MNIKLKASLITLGIIALFTLVIVILICYPITIFILAIGIPVITLAFVLYDIVLDFIAD